MRLLLTILFVCVCGSAFAETAWRYDENSALLVNPTGEDVPTGKMGELLPSKNTTLERPMTPEKGKWPKFDPKTDKWVQVELYVGRTVYEKATKAPLKIEYEKHGNAVPDGFTLAAPPENCEFCEWDESSQTWPENTVKKDAVAEEIARQKAIGQDDSLKTLREKLDGATLFQLRKHVTDLFPNLNKEQQEFLVGLLLLAK